MKLLHINLFFIVFVFNMIFNFAYSMSGNAKLITTSRFARRSLSTGAMNKTPSTTIKPIQSGIVKTGAFISQLPEIYPGDIYFKKALKKAREIKLDTSIKNLRNANRKLGAQFLDGLMKGLTVPITNVLHLYNKELKHIHPYEITVVNLTVVARAKAGHPHLEDVLLELKSLRSATSKLAKEYAVLAKTATTAVEARDYMLEGVKQLEALYHTSDMAVALKDIGEIQKSLKRIPAIELSTPSVVLVGAPNVGKSSIVRAVSSGTPEVNDYPFTTRGVTVGHIVDAERGTRFQVMDTPGLLDRPEGERNEMERLTFASLQHLPTAVLFVIDPTGLSGEKSTLQAQLNVRNYLKIRFPKRPWLDIVSKADIPLSEQIQKLLPQPHLSISVHTEYNMEILKIEMNTLFSVLNTMLEEKTEK